MAATIQFFQFYRKLYERVGIYPRSCSNKWFGSYNFRNSVMLLCLSMMFLVSMAYLLSQANSIQEYGQAFYVSITELTNIVCLIAIIPRTTGIFILMEEFGGFVEKGCEFSKNKNLIDIYFHHYKSKTQ